MDSQLTTYRGFTLLELMIVLAIMGILMTIALPAYQNYLNQAYVAEALAMMEGVKLDVTEYHAMKGSFPAAGLTTTSVEGGLNYAAKPAGKYGAVELADHGQVIYAFNQTTAPVALRGSVISIQPGVDLLGTLMWQCGSTPATHVLCNGSVCEKPPVANATRMKGQFLLASCR